MKENTKINDFSDNYKSGIEIRYDLKRLSDIKNTIDDIISAIEEYEIKIQSEIVVLKDKIYQLTAKDNYVNNEESQKLVKKAHDRILTKEELLNKRNKVLMNQLSQFKETYNKLYSKEIKVRYQDLKEELEKSVEKIYINLGIGIVSYGHSKLSSIINEYKDKTCYIDMTISDKKHPEYYKKLNNILFIKRFPVDFNDRQYDNKTLLNHITVAYGFSDEAKRYTCLKIDDPSEINLKFKLGELTKEDENWNPVKLIREAVCNCKDKEYKMNKEEQKVKRI